MTKLQEEISSLHCSLIAIAIPINTGFIERNRYIAKAGTNAQGFHWFQIGGVYTLPAYRNKGLAAAAVAHLINTHGAEAHGFALFVKTANTAALRVYEKLGFEQCGLFRMSYWKAGRDHSPENSAVLDKRIADIRVGKNVSGHGIIGK